MKAGPQNRRFNSATCTAVSNALRRSKYLQQHTGDIILKLKNAPQRPQNVHSWWKISNLASLHSGKWLENGTITNNHSETPHEGFLKAA